MWNRNYFIILTFLSILSGQQASYLFDSDYVDVGNPANAQPTAGMTLEVWVKPNEDPAAYNFAGIISWGKFIGPGDESGFALIWAENKWRFVVKSTNGDVGSFSNYPGTEIPFDGSTWSHIAATYDGANAQIYLNGTLVESGSGLPGGAIDYGSNTNDFYFSKYVDGGGSDQFYKGNIDEVRLWNVLRNEAEIQSTMNDSLTGNEAELLGYWNFNGDSEGDMVKDGAPNANDGNIIDGDGTFTWDDDVFASGESTGACCDDASGNCEENTEGECDANGGTWQGEGTTCTPNPCATGPCFDMEITEADFPFNHLADLTPEDDDWDQSTFTYPDGEEHSNGANGMDYTYKLTLSEPATIYITTCDSETNVDIQIAVYTADCDESSWILFQDDSNLEIYYPDGTSEQFEFECISGFESNPTYANMLPLLDWDAGSYYVVVDDRAGGTGTVRTWFGYSLIVDSTSTSGDFTEVNYFFSEGVFGGDYQDVYNGNGIGLDTSDYSVEINPNGGNADQANLTSLESVTGGALAGGEETVILNLEYPNTPSGGEILTVGPASVSSIFNSVGVPLLDVDGITINLIDVLSPTVEFTDPENGAEEVPTVSNIEVKFTEAVRHSNDENITNVNASDCFTIENAETDENLTYSISTPDNLTFTLNPDGELPEYTYIRLSMLATIEDQNDNAFVFDTIRFRTADETPPQIQSSSISSINDYVAITFNEGVYSTNNGSGGLDATDLTYTFNSNGGNCDNISVSGLTSNTGSNLAGGESTIHALISLSAAPSGVETIIFSPADNSSIFDAAGNSMSTGEISDEVTLLASAFLISTHLADSNEYVDLGFSVGIYGNAFQTLPVYLSGFESSIETNGGTATSVTLTSITDLENNALVGGEDSIRIYMSFDQLPSGVETITLSPATGFSIYSLSGVPVPEGELYGPILLNDQAPPVGTDDIEDGATNMNEVITISISFNENIYIPETGNQATIADLAPYITLSLDDSGGEPIPFILEIEGEPPTITLRPVEDYPSDATIYYAFSAVLQDENGNSIEYDFEATFTIRDYLPPEIQSSSMSPVNSYVALQFNEPVYANDNGSGGLDISDLTYVYSVNGGNCESASVTALTKENGTAVEGGESTVRALLELSGSASGVETLVFSPAINLSIFDASGNAMLSSVESDPVTLFASAYIESHSLADSNEFVDLYFSVGVYGNSIQTQSLYLSALTVTLFSNGGSATSVTPTSLTDSENNPLSGGEDTIRLIMSFNNLPSGEEKIIIAPTTAYSIYSYSGIPVPTSEVSDSIQLNDQQPPMGDDSIVDGATDVSQGDSLTLIFSEDLYIPQTGEIATVSDLAGFITLKIDDSTGADIPFTLTLDGSPPTLTINPVEDYPSESVIYYSFEATLADVNGNAVEINFEASFTIQDYLAPTVDSSALALDNSYLDLIFDEEIYGTDQESGAISENVIQLEFFSHGSVTDTVMITSLTRTDSNFLIGGETNIRINLEYNSTPSGDETMVITVENGVAIYDDSGNQMSGQAITDTIQLYDILPPSIETISVPIDSFIILMENTPITFSFNEKVDSLEFTVTAVVADSVNFDSTKSDSAIEITLQPPFTSFDSITVYFSYMEDEAGLSTVDIAYTYVTPLLGDYNLDSSLSFVDLDTLVKKWKQKDYNFELAPVTGEAPHFVSTPDSKFDIEDGMAFVRMWSWYQKTYGEITKDTAAVGRPLEMIQNDNDLWIILDKHIHAGQIQFSYEIGESPIQFDHRQNKSGELFITNQNPEKGFSILEFARTGEVVEDTFSMKLENGIQDIGIYYKLIDGTKKIVQKGTINVNGSILPTKVALYPAYPNPFNPITTIRFDIPEVEMRLIATLHIYDIRGRLVETLVNGRLLPGTYSVKWQADGFASGMYFARLRYGKEMKTQKILLLK